MPEWVGLHEWKWRHRQRVELGPDGAALDVTSPEGDGGESSDRQWRDVLGVLKNQRELLDLSVLRQKADECRIADLLMNALDAAGLG